jgi:PleD family two-component response regulator
VQLDERHRLMVVSRDGALSDRLAELLMPLKVEVAGVTSPASLLRSLEDEQPDALVLDDALGRFEGLDLVAQLRQNPRFESLPVLALLGSRADDAIDRALRAGVDAWLASPAPVGQIAMAAVGMLHRLQVFRRLGGKEPMTGLYTRTAFLDLLDTEVSKAQRAGRRVALLVAHIRDTDDGVGPPPLPLSSAYSALASVAKQTFRRSDLIGRIDDRTIAIGLPDGDARIAIALARRLASAVRESLDIEIAASLGAEGVTGESLLTDAESRLRNLLAGHTDGAIGHCRVGAEIAQVRAAEARPRVLVVDHDETIVRLIDFFCRREGWEVETAYNAFVALQRLEAAAAADRLPDLVVAEAYLVGMSGAKLLEAIRGTYGARVGVVMLHAKSHGEHAAEALSLGAVDSIAKPFSVPEMLARLRNALARVGAL